MTPLWPDVERLLPRLLSQIDRDPTSPTFGCADRTWWHYKTRDFPSIILQQAGEAVWAAAEILDADPRSPGLRELAAASCRFWDERARRFGAFEEYYPYERGYPPLAFSTRSIARLVAVGAVDRSSVAAGLELAARQLTRRFEAEAANQQVAGLAACAWLHRLDPGLVSARDLDRIVDRTLRLQHPEGWLPEYGGPDTGYLTVALDCLWDAVDACGDERLVGAARGAVRYLDDIVGRLGGSPGMLNSRNTDYLLPYGVLRAARSTDDELALRGERLFAHVVRGLEGPDHPLHATDDRYLCHYTGLSWMRAAAEPAGNRIAVAGAGRPEPSAALATRIAGPVTLVEGAGLAFVSAGEVSLAVAVKKGGLLVGDVSGRALGDFGWTVRSGNQTAVTNWWSSSWEASVNDHQVRIVGSLVPVRRAASTPWRHLALRMVALVAGRRLIGLLKRRLIHREASGRWRLERTVTWTGDTVTVEDRIEGLQGSEEVERSPRASKRYVASADTYHREDLLAVQAERRERLSRAGSAVTIVTVYE